MHQCGDLYDWVRDRYENSYGNNDDAYDSQDGSDTDKDNNDDNDTQCPDNGNDDTTFTDSNANDDISKFVLIPYTHTVVLLYIPVHR